MKAATCRDHQKKVKRKVILQWIVWYCNAMTFLGLEWVDKESGLFRTSWIHERSKHWDEKLVEHYKAWARYKKHPKKKNRSLKAGFRTSLNSKVKAGEVVRVKTEKSWCYWRIKKEFLKKYLNEEKGNSKFQIDFGNDENAKQVSYQSNNQPPLSPETSKEIEGEPTSNKVLPHFDTEFGLLPQKTAPRICALKQSNSSRSTQKEDFKSSSSSKGKKPTSSNKIGKRSQNQHKTAKPTPSQYIETRLAKLNINVEELLEGSPSPIPFVKSPDVLCGARSPPRFPPDYLNQPTPPSQPQDIVLENTGINEKSFYPTCLDFSSQMSPACVISENEQELQWQPSYPEYTTLVTPPHQSWDTNVFEAMSPGPCLSENNASFFYSSYNPNLSNPPLHHQDGFNLNVFPSTNSIHPPTFEELTNNQHSPTMFSQTAMPALQQVPDYQMAEQDQLNELPQELMIYLDDFFKNCACLDELYCQFS